MSEELRSEFFLTELLHAKGTLEKNLNAFTPSEHPPVRGKNVETFRWDHRLQRQNIYMAFIPLRRNMFLVCCVFFPFILDIKFVGRTSLVEKKFPAIIVCCVS